MMTVDEFWSAIGRVLLLGYAARVAYTIGRDNEARRRERATEARELARIERRRAIRAAALAALKPELDKLDEATRMEAQSGEPGLLPRYVHMNAFICALSCSVPPRSGGLRDFRHLVCIFDTPLSGRSVVA
jgi:hypothetical protein